MSFQKVREVLDNKVPLKLSTKRQLLLAFRDVEPSTVCNEDEHLKTYTGIIRELQTTGTTKALRNRNWNQKYVAAKLASLYVLFRTTTRKTGSKSTVTNAALGAFHELSKALVGMIPSEESTTSAQNTSLATTTNSTSASENGKKRASETQMASCSKRQRALATQTELVAMADDVLVLIASFCEPLQLRAMWFVCRPLRNFLLAKVRLVWGPHAGENWADADWISQRESVLIQCHGLHSQYELTPTACPGCHKVVAKKCILEQTKYNPSCLSCLNDAAMIRHWTARFLFGLDEAQLQTLSYRTLCPRSCIARSHVLSRPGHEKVYQVDALRRVMGVSMNTYSRSLIQNIVSEALSFRGDCETELRSVVKAVSAQKQLFLAERCGFEVPEYLLPFADDSHLFEFIADRFMQELISRCVTSDRMGQTTTDTNAEQSSWVSPRQLITLRLNASVPELRQFVDPDNVGNSNTLPPSLNKELTEQAREGLDYSLQVMFDTVSVSTYDRYGYSPSGSWFRKSYDRFIKTIVEKGYLKSDHYFAVSVKTVLLQFIFFTLEQPLRHRVFTKVASPERSTSLLLSAKERAFVESHVLVPESQSSLWSQVEQIMIDRAGLHIVTIWKEKVLERGDSSAFYIFLGQCWQTMKSSRKACFTETYRLSRCLLDHILVGHTSNAMDASQLLTIERIRDFHEESKRLESLQARSPQEYSKLAPVMSSINDISKTAMAWAVENLGIVLRASFPPGSLSFDSLKTDRTKRLLLKEFGGERNLGVTLCQRVLEIYWTEAANHNREAQQAVVKRDQEAKRAAAEALVLTPEEMEEAGVKADGPIYRCRYCGDDHPSYDCDDDDYYM